MEKSSRYFKKTTEPKCGDIQEKTLSYIMAQRGIAKRKDLEEKNFSYLAFAHEGDEKEPHIIRADN